MHHMNQINAPFNSFKHKNSIIYDLMSTRRRKTKLLLISKSSLFVENYSKDSRSKSIAMVLETTEFQDWHIFEM